MNTCRRLALRYTELLMHLAALLQRARKVYYRDTTLSLDAKLKL
jgi:hypothetical protein